jgi:HD-GYP domain-containing protein (c-di-GMP phosphodiesterase class II)
MLRVPAQARALMAAVVTLGTAVVAFAALNGALAAFTTLALLATAAVLTEVFQIPSDETSLDPSDAHTTSFSTSVHFAAVLILGPWAAAAVAAFGVVTVDAIRGEHWSRYSFNASALALATFAGGQAFQFAGGEHGTLALPAELPAIAALMAVYSAVNALAVGPMIAFSSASSPARAVIDAFRTEFASTIAQAGLGVLLAVCALEEPWAMAALIPLVIAVFNAHGRLAILRRETARALQTFANVVDERDPYTYEHSARVGEYVRRLAESLRLPAAEVSRLQWSGRLHDLGKIAVDAAVLRKPGKLSEPEWASLRRHPRLSARLLQRFRFAAGEARAVEYHHERFDGTGYYGVDPKSIPLAAHFLIVADAYDAMRSDRPYRLGLPKEQALAEIEANAGKQFHPAVAKAFVALERGEDPLSVLSPSERDELQAHTLTRNRVRVLLGRAASARPDAVPVGSIAAGLFLAGLHQLPLAAAAFAFCAASLAWRRVQSVRGRRLAGELQQALAARSSTADVFNDVATRLAYACHLRWAGLVSWSPADLAGRVEIDWGSPVKAPSETALGSWLMRETEAAEDVLVASDAEVGAEGAHVAVPLCVEGTVTGYLVLVFARAVPRHVDVALSRCGRELAGAFAQPGRLPRTQRLAAVS